MHTGEHEEDRPSLVSGSIEVTFVENISEAFIKCIVSGLGLPLDKEHLRILSVLGVATIMGLEPGTEDEWIRKFIELKPVVESASRSTYAYTC